MKWPELEQISIRLPKEDLERSQNRHQLHFPHRHDPASAAQVDKAGRVKWSEKFTATVLQPDRYPADKPRMS
jgi:hypothetical protein